MNHYLRALTLPVELLSLVFDTLSLQELLGASHVSKFWRAVAWRHPTFWGDVTLSSLSTASLDFFYTRLDAGSSRSIAIRLHLPEVESPARLRSVVLPAVTANLYRVDMLSLQIDVAFDTDCFNALRHPAPRLDTLDVVIANESRTSDALPVDLFASQAPKLRFVRLINTQLFAERLPRAFSSIRNLRYCFTQPQSFPTALFTHCKLLRTLMVYGMYCTLVHDTKNEQDVRSTELESIDLSVFSGSVDIMRHLPCAGIPDITSTLNDHESAALLLAHLRGWIDVHLYQVSKRLYVQYKSPNTGIQRAFACLPSQADEAYLPPVYVSDDLVSRVKTVHCASTCIGLLPAYHELPACTRVVVKLGEGDSLVPPPRRLAAPALEHVELSSKTPALMSVNDLLAFLDSALAPVPRTVQVSMVGIALDGNLTALGERFRMSMVS